MPKITYATIVPVEGQQYDQVPCCLFTLPEYQALSLDAKLLYSRMLSLTSYAGFKGWEDRTGIYITMSRAKIMAYLNCAGQKATKVLRELLEADLVQLENEEINNGKIYVKKAHGIMSQMEGDFFRRPFKLSFSFWQLPRSLSKELSAGARLLYACLNTVKNTVGGVCAKIEKLMLSKRLGMDVRTLAKHLSQLVTNGLLNLRAAEKEGAIQPDEVTKEQPEKESAPSVIATQEEAKNQNKQGNYSQRAAESQVLAEKQKESVKRLVDYEYQRFRTPQALHWVLDKAIEMLTNLVYCTDKQIWLNGKNHPASEIKRILQRFTKAHLSVVMDSYLQQRERIRNIDAWLKTVLVNAVLEDAPSKKAQKSKGSGSRRWSATARKSDFHVGSISYPDETEVERRARIKEMCDRLIE